MKVSEGRFGPKKIVFQPCNYPWISRYLCLPADYQRFIHQKKYFRDFRGFKVGCIGRLRHATRLGKRLEVTPFSAIHRLGLAQIPGKIGNLR